PQLVLKDQPLRVARSRSTKGGVGGEVAIAHYDLLWVVGLPSSREGALVVNAPCLPLVRVYDYPKAIFDKHVTTRVVKSVGLNQAASLFVRKRTGFKLVEDLGV